VQPISTGTSANNCQSNLRQFRNNLARSALACEAHPPRLSESMCAREPLQPLAPCPHPSFRPPNGRFGEAEREDVFLGRRGACVRGCVNAESGPLHSISARRPLLSAEALILLTLRPPQIVFHCLRIARWLGLVRNAADSDRQLSDCELTVSSAALSQN
jgi:hypothetical protein